MGWNDTTLKHVETMGVYLCRASKGWWGNLESTFQRDMVKVSEQCVLPPKSWGCLMMILKKLPKTDVSHKGTNYEKIWRSICTPTLPLWSIPFYSLLGWFDPVLDSIPSDRWGKVTTILISFMVYGKPWNGCMSSGEGWRWVGLWWESDGTTGLLWTAISQNLGPALLVPAQVVYHRFHFKAFGASRRFCRTRTKFQTCWGVQNHEPMFQLAYSSGRDHLRRRKCSSGTTRCTETHHGSITTVQKATPPVQKLALVQQLWFRLSLRCI